MLQYFCGTQLKIGQAVVIFDVIICSRNITKQEFLNERMDFVGFFSAK